MEQQDVRRATPRTDHVLDDPRLKDATTRLGRRLVKAAAVTTLDRCRRGEIAPGEVVTATLQALPDAASTLRQVVNATGVLVHTNLGRAPLSAAAVSAITTAAGATDVELSLDSGLRDRRGRGTIAALSAAVPEAGGVHVVNNGAAALALVTLALAAGRRILVARGEMVEIGDGFRIPELVESLGAVLREVGTTNRVRLQDYADAIDDDTAFVLKVHPSNFVVSGFTSSVARGRARHPAGAGRLRHRLGAAGAAPAAARRAERRRRPARRGDLVTASGDKLLGGPQCGLLLGDGDLVESLRRHPFARALRVDKLTLAALEATLTGPDPPVPAALQASRAALLARAPGSSRSWPTWPCRAGRRVAAAVGGGGAPDVVLPSAAVALPPWPRRCGSAPRPVVGRVERGRLLLDLLARRPDDDATVVDAVRARRARARGTERARHRHRRARGPRQVHAGPGAHREGPRPAGGGAPAGTVDRARLRVDRAARCGDVAFVDVPGHERFISTMLAGVGPVPAVLFVVAADDPWMPQAAEHLAALDALRGAARARGGHPRATSPIRRPRRKRRWRSCGARRSVTSPPSGEQPHRGGPRRPQRAARRRW